MLVRTLITTPGNLQMLEWARKKLPSMFLNMQLLLEIWQHWSMRMRILRGFFLRIKKCKNDVEGKCLVYVRSGDQLSTRCKNLFLSFFLSTLGSDEVHSSQRMSVWSLHSLWNLDNSMWEWGIPNIESLLTLVMAKGCPPATNSPMLEKLRQGVELL